MVSTRNSWDSSLYLANDMQMLQGAYSKWRARWYQWRSWTLRVHWCPTRRNLGGTRSRRRVKDRERRRACHPAAHREHRLRRLAPATPHQPATRNSPSSSPRSRDGSFRCRHRPASIALIWHLRADLSSLPASSAWKVLCSTSVALNKSYKSGSRAPKRGNSGWWRWRFI